MRSQREQEHWPYIPTGHIPESYAVQNLVRYAH